MGRTWAGLGSITSWPGNGNAKASFAADQRQVRAAGRACGGDGDVNKVVVFGMANPMCRCICRRTGHSAGVGDRKGAHTRRRRLWRPAERSAAGAEDVRLGRYSMTRPPTSMVWCLPVKADGSVS